MTDVSLIMKLYLQLGLEVGSLSFLYWDFCLDLYPIFKLVFLDIDFLEFFIYFGYEMMSW